MNYPYNHEFDNDFSQEELYKAVKNDSRLVIDTVLKNTAYNNFYIIGKSIGTIAMSSELNRDVFKDAKTIWLTPLLKLDEVFKSIMNSRNKGLCIIGDNDRNYTEELFSELVKNENITSKLIPGANHSLNNEDAMESIDNLKSIMMDIERFLIDD